jgi:hypothetical protein
LRRWKESLTEPAKGVTINPDGSSVVSPVETRLYNDYMLFGPLPDSEVQKWGLIQNAGW